MSVNEAKPREGREPHGDKYTPPVEGNPAEYRAMKPSLTFQTATALSSQYSPSRWWWRVLEREARHHEKGPPRMRCAQEVAVFIDRLMRQSPSGVQVERPVSFVRLWQS